MSASREHRNRWKHQIEIKKHREWERQEPPFWRFIAHYKWKASEPWI